MDQGKKPSKTLPYILIGASAIVLLILINGVLTSGEISIAPIAIVLFVATIVVAKNTWFQKRGK